MRPSLIPLTVTHLDVLYHLVIGTQPMAIAQDLDLSARSVARRLADLEQALNAPDRFGLGVGAIRRRWIDPAYPIRHASMRREGDDWVEPSRRQHEIILLRAGGTAVDEVASKLRTSISSVRRDLARLATDNDARAGANAAALFEAWAGSDRERQSIMSDRSAHPALSWTRGGRRVCRRRPST